MAKGSSGMRQNAHTSPRKGRSSSPRRAAEPPGLATLKDLNADDKTKVAKLIQKVRVSVETLQATL